MRNVLDFNNFEVFPWVLVKSLDLSYKPSGALTYLTSAVVKGYLKKSGSYKVKVMPAVEFKYTEPAVENTLKQIESESLKNLPAGLDEGTYQWVDLRGEGSPGILSRQGPVIYYKENLGGGKFGAMQAVKTPTALDHTAQLQLTDIDGDGANELIVRSGSINGFYHLDDGEWKTYTAFEKNPAIDWNNPNMKVLDINGDGHPDLLISEDYVFRWYPSEGQKGYDQSVIAPKELDELKGPAVVFSDHTGSIYISDMTGDGLADIVRIRNGEICYWPNLGFGRFGGKVFMDNAPVFDTKERFDPNLIKLGDIDGSGSTDIIYIGGKKPCYYLNQAGNSWSAAKTIDNFRSVDSLSSVSLVDIEGKGTMCLVWSTKLPGRKENQMSYIDLMGIKPHLLCEIKDNMGSITKLAYAPSTKFYLEDKKKGNPWITRLPFPIHTLEKVVNIDEVSGLTLTTLYHYHHGYYDGVEREFRGFGLVETIDTEEQGVQGGEEERRLKPAATSMDDNDWNNGYEYYSAPVLTRTWYHTGAFIKTGIISRQYEHEYYSGDPDAFLLPDTVLENDGNLNADEMREAYRALKGSALRQEVYELGKATPYEVKEANFAVKNLQPINKNKHAVFFTHANEAITYHYEQQQADPRVSHELTIEVDNYGNLKKSMQAVYPRRNTANTLPEQLKAYATLNVKEFYNQTADFYRIGLVLEELTYELGKEIPINAYSRLTLETAKAFVFESLNHVLMPEEHFSSSVPQARLISKGRQLFWNTEQTADLPYGQVTEKELVHHTETAVFTPGLIQDAYGTLVNITDLNNAGYLLRDGFYFNPGLIQFYHQGSFYLPVKTQDPFGGFTQVSYDTYMMFPVKTEDALGNTSSALVDYRTLSPWKLTDPNNNISEALSDELGMVCVTSVYGQEAGVNKGDYPLFDSNGDPIYTIIENASADDVLANPKKYLQNATTFFYYELECKTTSSEPGIKKTQPPHFVELARETHVRDLANGETTRIQKTIGFSDGFEREVQTKTLVEPGKAWVLSAPSPLTPLPEGEGDKKKTYAEQFTEERWLTSGRKVFNNKGKPVKQYEPFYSAIPDFEDEEFFNTYGVTPVIHYDPLQRVIRTDTPKGFFSKTEFNPWEVFVYDENDTVLDSDYYKKYDLLSPEEKEALDKTLPHYNTPKITLLDTLGREFAKIETLAPLTKNAGNKSDANQLITYTEFDITGSPISITDPRQYADSTGVKNYQYAYDMHKQLVRTQHIDGGDDRVFYNVLGSVVFTQDSKGHKFSTTYDILQRPIAKKVEGNALNNTVERYIYGETQPNAWQNNLRGKLYKHYDPSGSVTIPIYSFKGEALRTEKRIRTEYKLEANWIDGANWDNLLDTNVYSTISTFDALGKLKTQQNTDLSEMKPEYHLSGTLNKVNVKLKGETAFKPFVTGITYNAKGQREQITYGNNTQTSYAYEKETFRLTTLNTKRTNDSVELQDIYYTYDPTGNITRIKDNSQQRVFHNNQMVDPENKYVYDALYRLIEANGREHTGLNIPDYYKNANSFKQSQYISVSDPNDSNKLANYSRKYTYDQSGNLTQIKHIASDSVRSFTRDIAIDEQTNRGILKENNNLIDFNTFFDLNGNCINLENIREMNWNYRDNISKAVIIKRPGNTDDAEYYVYDSSGQRIRKISERLVNGNIETEDKLYLGGVEVKRIKTGNTAILERTSLHVMDDKKRIAISHNWTRDNNNREINSSSELNTNKTRYQYSNHIDSASLETDTNGLLISYEEYYPYGDTSFIAGNTQKEVKLKEYRYTGKERDDFTGLYYYGARYYASWLGRWLSDDPLFRENPSVYERPKGKDEEDQKQKDEEYKTKLYSEGLNLYCYVRNNPITHNDPEGLNTEHKYPQGEMDLYQTGQHKVDNDPGAMSKALSWMGRFAESALSVIPNTIMGIGQDVVNDVKYIKNNGLKAYGKAVVNTVKQIPGNIAESVKNEVNYYKNTPMDKILKDAGNQLSSPEAWGQAFGNVGIALLLRKLPGGNEINKLIIPGRVQSRINITNLGWNHILKRHFNLKVNASQFTITPEELKNILKNKEIIKASITKAIPSGDGLGYIREIKMKNYIGLDKFKNGAPTKILSIMTNKFGELLTATPGKIK